MKKSIKLLFTLGLINLSLLSITSCDNNTSSKTKVTIGVCGSSNEYWKAVQYVLDQQEANIDIDLVQFNAYNLPNNALNAKEIDLNSFQHKAFLENEIKTNNYKIEAIGDTLIAPLTLYSKKYGSLENLKQAAGTTIKDSGKIIIAIPNDGTNQARGIKLLEQCGLINVNPDAGYNPGLSDITSYNYNIEIRPAAANTLPSLLDDLGGATINGTYAIPSGLIPSKDGLEIESSERNSTSNTSNPYVNVIVARSEDKDNQNYKKIVQAYQTTTVANYLLAKYSEAFFPAFNYEIISGEELTNLVSTIDKIEL